MTRYSILLISLCLLNTSLPAQHQEIIFEQYKGTDLADWIRCMYQDSRGFLWIGTVDELNRFDGYANVVYQPEPGDTNSISGNHIQCLFEDRTGMLWIGTQADGLNKYNRFTDKFTRFRHDHGNPGSISDNCVTAIYEDKDLNLWVGTQAGLNRLDREKNQFTCYTQQRGQISIDRDVIRSITEDESGLLWIGTDRGLYLFDKNQNQFHSFKNCFGLGDVFETKRINLCEEESGVFWICTAVGLFQFNKNSVKLTHYPINTPNSHPIFSNQIQAVYDAGDFLWLGTADGLYKFEKGNELFTRYEHDSKNYLSLFENNIMVILKDKSGCIWFCPPSKGVNKRNSIRNSVKYYLPNPFDSGSIEDRIVSLCLSSSGKIWMGTHSYGMLSFDKHKEEFRLYQHDSQNSNSLSSNDVYCVYEDRKGFVWIGTADGLNKFNPATGKFVRYKYNLQDNNSISHSYVQSIIESADGSIYIGTLNGLNCFNPVSAIFTRYLHNPENPQSISHNIVIILYADSDNIIWIGTRGGGLNRFDPKSGQFKQYKNDPRNPHSISSDIVEAIFEPPTPDRAILWIGTQGGGLCRFDKKSEQFTTFTKKDGLPANRVQKIIADQKGNLWLTTIECITIFDPIKKSFKNFEMSSELPVNPHTCLIDRDGEIFLGGYRGLVRFFPDSMKNNPHIPNIVVTDFKVNYKPADLDTTITEKKAIVLSYKQNVLSFEFAALDFNRSGLNQYAYKMEGVDNDWVFTDANRRYATYTNLDPGKYTFHVKGSNNDGVWNEEGVSIKVIITPPWWQTIWARMFYTLLFLASLAGIIRFEVNRNKRKAAARLREEQERRKMEVAEQRAIVAELQVRAAEAEKEIEKEQMRARIASDLHDEIGSNLSTIAIVSQMAADKFKAGNVEKRRLQKIPRLARQTAESMRDIIWFINPENDSMDRLLIKMRQTANMMLENVDFTFDLPPESITFAVDVNFRRNLYLVFKEALQNIVRHARATKVNIGICESDGCAVLRVSDDGVGFDPQAEYQGNGLKNFRRRAKEIGGQIEIISTKGRGTTVTLCVKIP